MGGGGVGVEWQGWKVVSAECQTPGFRPPSPALPRAKAGRSRRRRCDAAPSNACACFLLTPPLGRVHPTPPTPACPPAPTHLEGGLDGGDLVLLLLLGAAVCSAGSREAARVGTGRGGGGRRPVQGGSARCGAVHPLPHMRWCSASPALSPAFPAQQRVLPRSPASSREGVREDDAESLCLPAPRRRTSCALGAAPVDTSAASAAAAISGAEDSGTMQAAPQQMASAAAPTHPQPPFLASSLQDVK